MKALGCTLALFASLLLTNPIWANTNSQNSQIDTTIHTKSHKITNKKKLHLRNAKAKTIQFRRSAKKSSIKRPKPIYAKYDTQNVIDIINQAIHSVNNQATVGIQIKSMKYGDMLYSQNDSRSFAPASILKIMTAEAALLYLGADFKYPTRLLTTASKASNGVIDGDVYLVHSGDPSLTYYDLTDLVLSLKSQQIQTINGNVYIDTSAYDQDNTGPGWNEKDAHSCFAAPINASIIDHNCISLQIGPAKGDGQLANIIENPRFYYAGIDNTVVTKSRARACYIKLNTSDNNIIELSGCIAKNNYPRGASVVINNIDEYNKSLLNNLFRRFGIEINGQIDIKSSPTDLFTVASHDSKPVYMLINQMLKKSDNIIAGSLFKKLGELYTRQPGSWNNGSLAVKQILAKNANVNTSQMNIIDGSGLSHYNQITPAQMMKVLDFAFHNYSTNYEFISALPIAGVDGTLKHRLQNVAGKVRAKTGTIAGVVSLAGYAMNKDKEPIAFVIMINGGQHGNVWKYRQAEDKIVTALVNYSRNG